MDNYVNYIKFAGDNENEPTNTDPLSGKIELDPNATEDENVLGLAHELTNRIMKDEEGGLEVDVFFGKITPEEYAKEALQLESNAIYSQFKVAKELKIKSFGRGADPTSDKQLRSYERGEISDEALKKQLKGN
ncbi:MAG TPA: hypothetical protein VGM41_15610 [Chitinophagaceae bacterium]|jgi:hypothetical protein